MKAVIVYESMFGNTRLVAEAIAEGLRQSLPVEVFPVADATEATFDNADLLVVGGPTHVHGLPTATTRHAAIEMTEPPESGLVLEPQSGEVGVREWLESAGELPVLYAAFDTRADAFKWFTGSAAHDISKTLKHRARTEVIEPGSFIAPDNEIDASELDRARAWGAATGIAALERLGIAMG